MDKMLENFRSEDAEELQLNPDPTCFKDLIHARVLCDTSKGHLHKVARSSAMHLITQPHPTGTPQHPSRHNSG